MLRSDKYREEVIKCGNMTENKGFFRLGGQGRFFRRDGFRIEI